jgi:hypothetical protein
MKRKVSVEGGMAIGPEADGLGVRWRRRPSSHRVRRDDLDVFEIITVSIDGELCTLVGTSLPTLFLSLFLQISQPLQGAD